MPEEVLDYLVVGAGPAGLQLGCFLAHAGRGYRILEGASAPGTSDPRIRYDTRVERIRKERSVFVATGSSGAEYRARQLVAATGFHWDASIFDEDVRPALGPDGCFPAQTSSWESVNVPGLYFAGTVTQVCEVRALHRILEERHHGKPWPHTALTSELDELTGAVIARASALDQRSGFLGDVLVVDGREARYYEEVPVGHFAEGKLSDAEQVFVLTVDHGRQPIVRHYRRGELVAAHHLAEDREDEQLKKFLARRLATAGV